jgi:hypothetical protein
VMPGGVSEEEISGVGRRRYAVARLATLLAACTVIAGVRWLTRTWLTPTDGKVLAASAALGLAGLVAYVERRRSSALGLEVVSEPSR